MKIIVASNVWAYSAVCMSPVPTIRVEAWKHLVDLRSNITWSWMLIIMRFFFF